ncbi:reticulon-4 receptor isoform X2 [Corythoichthys intestinalis]|uniref:reticulon-4 receptor isoform X2 n=1 Tax=Corythoichthys intestinalis TaxID=161448 RepID=UPI0025A6648D|nr:reticulon-4 receptor isoform X2 [Corythoichthys intestinalis]
MRIEVLLFARNLFSSLSWESFQIMSELHELDLTANEVGLVTVSAVPLLLRLAVLRLGRNRLTALPGRAFFACPALTELHLEDNAIESLKDDTFAGLGILEVLDLSSNRIRVLPPFLLRPLVAIETIYLENNLVGEVPDDWFNPKEDVPFLFLSANSWACFCSLTYLSAYLGDFFFNFYVRDGTIISRDPRSLVCHSPPWLKDRAVYDVHRDDLCRSTTPPQTVPTAPSAGPTGESRDEGGRGDGAVIWRPAVTEGQDEGGRGDGAVVWRPAQTASFFSLPGRTVTTMSYLATLTPSLPTTVGRQRGWNESSAASFGRPPSAGVFCVWLLAGYACLCAMGLGCTLLTLAKLAVLYKVAYEPLSATLARGRGGTAEGGAEAVYRSMLFVSRESREAYRTTLYREPGTQVALQQWSDAMGGGQDAEGGAGWRQRFSVLLRQERAEPGGVREERDWVVGEWLAQYLPGVTRDVAPLPVL